MPSYNPPRYLFRRYEILRHVLRNGEFLEIGTGNIKLARSLLKYFSSGTIVDFSPYVENFYKQLPEHEREKLLLKVGDFSKMSFEREFDCVVTCEVMEHIENDLGFLQTIHKLLANKGQIILSVPSRMKYWSIHDEIVGHLRRYEKNDIVALFKSAGFENIQVLSYGFPFVNLLRLPRILLAKKQHAYKQHWETRKQTEVSGAHHASDSFNWMGWFVNKYTFLPLCWFASLFNRFDMSDGYIVVAFKSN